MALTACRECGNEVSKSAKTCPKCGAKRRPRMHPVALGCAGLGVAMFLIVVIAAANAAKTAADRADVSTAVVSADVQSTENTPSAEQQSKPEITFLEGPWPEVEQDPEPVLHSTGDEVVIGHTSYLVRAAGWRDQITTNFGTERPNARFLVVVVTVRNDDKEARVIPPFQLVDTEGAEYDTWPNSWLLEGSFNFLDELNPGVAKKGGVVFDVPAERTYRLRVSGGIWSNESALIALEPTERK